MIFNSIGICAGAMVSVWGVVRICAALGRALRARRGRHRSETERQLESIRRELERISEIGQANSDAIATLQCESLCHVFAEYVEKGKPCPISVKQAVAAMYEEYTRDARHNHVAKDYLERLMALPAE